MDIQTFLVFIGGIFIGLGIALASYNLIAWKKESTEYEKAKAEHAKFKKRVEGILEKTRKDML